MPHSNEQVAPEKVWLQRGQAQDPSECTLSHVSTDGNGEVEYIRLDLHTAALAKQGSPPEPDEQDYATAEVIDAAIAQGKRSQSLIPSLSPPADTDERAREIVRRLKDDGFVVMAFDEIGNAKTGEQIAAELAARISAALVEAKREAWNKAIEGVRKLRDEWQEKQGDWDKHTMGMVDSAVHIIAALEAACAAEKGK